MIFFNYLFTPLTLLPINEIYAWSNNEKIHLIAHHINDLIKSNENQDEAIKKITDYLNGLDDTIKDDVFEMLMNWYNDGSLKSLIETKKIIMVGDSYLDGAGLPSPSTSNFGAILRGKGFDVTTLSTSGGGFDVVGVAGTYGAGYTFQSVLEHYVSLLEDESETDLVTDLFFMGGVNDSYSSANLAQLPNAINSAIVYACQTFKNAKVHIGYISQLRRFNSNILRINAVKELYRRACIGNPYRCCYMNNADHMLKGASLIQEDGIHPTYEGQRYIATYLTSYLLNNNISPYRIEVINYSLDNSNPDYATQGYIGGSIVQDGNIVRMSMLNSTAFTFNSPQFTFNGVTRCCIGKINNLIWGQSNTQSTAEFGACQTTVSGTITITQNEEQKTIPCAMTLCIYQDHLFIVPQLLDNASTYTTATLQQINLNPFTAVFSADDC